MTMNTIKDNFIGARDVLDKFMGNERNWELIEQVGKEMVKAIKRGNKIISCGNGGSMSDAMHFAEELTGRFRDNRPSVAAIAVSDPAHITCVANDYGYEFIFSRFIESMGNKGDVLLAISTSGNSGNVIQAAKTAREKGLHVAGLTGKDGGMLAQLCDTEVRVAHDGYADRIQEVHIKIIHSLIHYIELNL